MAEAGGVMRSVGSLEGSAAGVFVEHTNAEVLGES
jgi:hypothetical protein